MPFSRLAPWCAAVLLAVFLVGCSSTEKTSHDYFPVNDAGYSYGSGSDEFVRERYIKEFGYPETNEEWQNYMRITTPDLIAAVNEDGLEGYVFDSETRSEPKTLEEAAEVTKLHDVGFEVNMYDAETMEVIGKMRIGGREDDE